MNSFSLGLILTGKQQETCEKCSAQQHWEEFKRVTSKPATRHGEGGSGSRGESCSAQGQAPDVFSDQCPFLQGRAQQPF